MEEEKYQPNQENGVVEDKEAQRILPSLFEVDLEELGLKD